MSLQSSAERSSLLYRWTDHTPDALFQARAALRRAAEEQGLSDEVAGDAVMAAAELMANAVEHACGPYELHLCRNAEELLCAVVDHDPNIPELPPFRESSQTEQDSDFEPQCGSIEDIEERGRGLGMVHRISRGAWGMQACGCTKVAWCSIALK
jgi:anti-sigma regulatory factor (Ser/Thr protein kinase)